MNLINIKKALLLMLVLLTAGSISAQETNYCKGLKNPTSFVISGSNPGNAQWYGFTGSRNNQASVCGTWGMTGWGTQINASQLASQSSGSSCTNGNSVNISGQSDYMNRFVIKGSGNDPLTSNHLSYLPPDPSYTSSIRLGNNCGGSHEAEMLCYQLDVRPQNSLIFIWYALSLQNGQHGASDNPEFAIEIEKKIGTNTWQRVGGDTLCYIRPTPAGSGSVAPFLRGATGQTGVGVYAENIYLPWNKVAINLNNYLYETVRIRIGAGDCAYSAHYACAYIAGECQPMEIKTSGCPAGSTTTVQTLTAPTGLNNYVWYKAAAGTEGISSLYSVSEDIVFTPLTPTTGVNTNNVYECQIEDFLLTAGTMAGQYTNEQVFRCDMTSQMNETIPFTSSVYVRVNNTKPLMSIDTLKNCDGGVTLTNKSYVPHVTGGCDTANSIWWVYSGANENTALLDSVVGAQIHFNWDTCGQYAVKVRSFYVDDRECYSDSTYTVNAMCRPTPIMEVEPSNMACASDSIILHDRTQGCLRHDWVIDDIVYPGPRTGHTNTEYGRVFTKYRTPVELVAYNGLFTRDSINTYDTIWCTASAYDTIEVFQHPELLVEGDTIVCNGDKTDITVSTETEGCTYRWFYTLGADNNQSIQNGANLRTLLNADTVKFYVKVTNPQRCEAWDSVMAYRVNPTLRISRHDMCEGDYVTLTADKAYNYSWIASPADSTLDMLLDSAGIGPSEITVRPKETTTYTLIGHGTNGCNADALTEYINVHPIPVAEIDAYPDFVDSDNPVVTLTDVSPYSVRRVWYFEEGTPEEYTSPCNHNFGEVSADSVTVVMVAYNDLECSDTITMRLPVTQFTFYAPNVFTPERPDNNKFRIYTANRQEFFSVYIYDRMGRLVYTSNDLDFRWDGNTIDGVKCPQGTYAWVVRYRRPGTEDIVTQKGVITLVR